MTLLSSQDPLSSGSQDWEEHTIDTTIATRTRKRQTVWTDSYETDPREHMDYNISSFDSVTLHFPEQVVVCQVVNVSVVNLCPANLSQS